MSNLDATRNWLDLLGEAPRWTVHSTKNWWNRPARRRSREEGPPRRRT